MDSKEDRTEAFREELKALFLKYGVFHDVVGRGTNLVFYPDCKGPGVILMTGTNFALLDNSAESLR